VTTAKRATLADVAAAAGVSKMTASRALRGASDVSRASIDKVQKAARDIGYVGNHLAMSLSSRRSNLIGVVVPGLTNIVFAEVLSGIAAEIAGSGMQPVFGTTDYDPEREYDVIRNMLSWNPSGLIVTGLDQPQETRRLLAAADIPVVQIMDLDGDPVDACVGFSHHAAGAAMAEALIRSGRLAFGYAGCGLERDTRARKRLAGFTETLSRHGLAFRAMKTRETLSTTGAGRALTKSLLAEAPDLDCIYTSNDDVAAGCAYHCIASGVPVPDQVLIAGFNGLEFVGNLPVPVATTITPRREIGSEAARIILTSGGGDDRETGRRIMFAPEIELGL
jgi:LacI family gluconate utilization system Gnt-I transcriptional repressor